MFGGIGVYVFKTSFVKNLFLLESVVAIEGSKSMGKNCITFCFLVCWDQIWDGSTVQPR